MDRFKSPPTPLCQRGERLTLRELVKNPRPEDVALISPLEGGPLFKSPPLGKGDVGGFDIAAWALNPPNPPFTKGGRNEP